MSNVEVPGYRGCSTKCPKRHLPYKLDEADRVRKEYDEAIDLASRRAERRGRQVVRRHDGAIVGRVWLVQDVRPVSH